MRRRGDDWAVVGVSNNALQYITVAAADLALTTDVVFTPLTFMNGESARIIDGGDRALLVWHYFPTVTTQSLVVAQRCD